MWTWVLALALALALAAGWDHHDILRERLSLKSHKRNPLKPSKFRVELLKCRFPFQIVRLGFGKRLTRFQGSPRV